jgi:biopolymer transport protein ExbD
MQIRTIQRTVFIPAFVLLLLSACDSGEQKKDDSVEPRKKSSEEEQPASASASMVEFFALPVSLRSGGSEPSGCHKVEMTPSTMRINGTQTIEIRGGRVADSEHGGDQIPELKTAMKSNPRPCIALEVHSNVSYQTVVQVLNTAQTAGIKTASFKVRKPMGSTKTGWLTLSNYKVIPYTDEEVIVDTVPARPWSDFTNNWDTVYSGCAAGQGAFCKEKPLKIAEGGKLQVVFFALGDGVNMEFRRVGAPDPNQEKGEEKADKSASKKKGKDKKAQVEDNPMFADMTPEQIEEYLNLPFAVEAAFQFRGQQAIVSPSPVSTTVAPICGKARCGVLITGQRRTITIRFLSLIGAAFPDGVSEPTIWFMLPNE